MQSRQNSKARVSTGTLLVGGMAFLFPQTSRAALLSNVAFDDSLANNGSTLDSASQSYSNPATPSSTSTNYDVASSKEAIGTPNSNLNPASPLELEMVSTSSGIAEVQAVFTSSPIQLSTIGQSIELTVTFKNTAGLNQNSSSAVYLGLYSSGGNTPYNDMGNGSSSVNTITGINNGEINNNSGGVQAWAGYEGDYFGGSSTKIYSRPAQTIGSNNTDQALVGEGQTGGPTGTEATFVNQNSSETTLTVGNTYTDEFSITLTSAGVYSITEDLYNGSTDTGTQIGTNTLGTLTALSSGGFDGLAIGYRQSDSMASEMDISSVEVTTNVPVPEPASLSLLVLAGMPLLSRRRRA